MAAADQQCFSSISGGDVALWSETANHSQRYEQNGLLQVFSEATADCRSLSWNNNNSLLACSPTRGDHVAILNYSDRELTVSSHIEAKSLLETGTADCVGGVSSNCFLGNGHQLLIGLTSPIVSLWDIETSSVVRNYVGHTSGITCVTRNTKDTYLVSGLEDGNLTVHKMSSSQPITQLTSKEENSERVVCVRFSPAEHAMIGSCDRSGAVRLWSVESQRLLTTFSVTHSGGANDIAFSPYNRMLMGSVGQNNLICLYDLIQRKIITQITSPVPMASVLLLKDGITMIGGGLDGKLYIYNMRNCKEATHVIAAHRRPITALASQNVVKTKARKLPSKSQKKKVTIDASIDVTTPSDTISPLVSSIVTPASNGRPPAVTSVFSPLESSEAPLPKPATILSPLSDTVSVTLPETPLHATDNSTIFSPLEHATHVASHLTLSKSSPLSLISQSKPHLKPQGTLSEHSFPSDSTLIHPPLTSSTLLVSSIPSQLQQPQIQSTPTTVPTPPRSPSRGTSSTPPKSTDVPTVAVTSMPSIQMQYLENMLKEQQDEIIWSTHRDINNLSVAMLRQFATLQNQMILALTAISEKVEKLTDEVENLKHKVNHLTPKY